MLSEKASFIYARGGVLGVCVSKDCSGIEDRTRVALARSIHENPGLWDTTLYIVRLLGWAGWQILEHCLDQVHNKKVQGLGFKKKKGIKKKFG